MPIAAHPVSPAVMSPTGVLPKIHAKALLLEAVHPIATQLLEASGCTVESSPKAMTEDELIARLSIGDIHFLGIRSKTAVTKRVLQAQKGLLAIGCFCIGTNQVDLEFANKKAIPVFNSPFANTRSVAELVICEVIALSRKLFLRSSEVHEGTWNKSNAGCYEVRGKTLGIVGYGHIGSQVGVMAEALGMRVVFYDVISKLELGTVKQVATMSELLAVSDFVSIHVPETSQTKDMIGADEFAQMKDGAYFLNLSRGTVVDLDALTAALKSGKVGGAAVDVFPVEPVGAGEKHVSPLQNVPNVILTPHIGGSTVEAQAAIGREVGAALAKFICFGTTSGAVNFPQVEPPTIMLGQHRLINTHTNSHGALRHVNEIIAQLDCNISRQILTTDRNIGYIILDVDVEMSKDLCAKVAKLPASIRTLVLS